MSIRIYGEFGGESSIPRVTRGFAQVFPNAAQFHLPTWENDLDDAPPPEPGATADVGLFVGSLGELKQMFRAKHKHRYVMVAPNSNTIGPLLSSALRLTDCSLMAPSTWAQRVLREAFPNKEVVLARHGIDSEFQPQPPPPTTEEAKNTFSVLHLSSTVLERKGTDKLLEGWQLAMLPDATLYLSVPLGRKHFFQEEAEHLGISKSVKITDRLDYSPSAMAALYASMHFVCQPSRGEGFGFVPLEARCCGTPVIATDCTGHADHVKGPGTVIVRTGEDAPIDDFPGARAPSLSAQEVAEALQRAHSERKRLVAEARESAEELRTQWSWHNQLKELKNELFEKLTE